MHRGLIALCLLSAGTVGAQPPTPQPGPEHKKLEVHVGTWTWEAEAQPSLFGPGGKMTGTDRNELLGDFFVVRRSEAKRSDGQRSRVLRSSAMIQSRKSIRVHSSTARESQCPAFGL